MDELQPDRFSFKEHIISTLSLAYPVIIGQVGHVLMGVVDTFWVGKLGAVPLAAASIANSMFFVIFVIGLGVTFAISPLVAISVGADKPGEANRILENGLLVNILVAVVLILIIFTGSMFIDYLKQPPDVAALAVVYLRIISLSILPLMIFQTYRQFIEGFTIMKPAMIIAIIGNIVNFIGNWILIFGKLGMPALGFEGSALATLTTRIFMAIAIVMYIRRAPKFKDYKLGFSLSSYNWNITRKILGVGLSSGFQYFFEVGAFSSAAVMIGWIGTSQLAAHQIALNLASITYMAATGLSAAAAIRVGSAVGRQINTEIRHAGFSAIFLGASWMLLTGIFFVIFRYSLPGFYINDYTVTSVASSLLMIAALFQISDGVQCVGLGVLRGMTDVKIPTAITFISYWILGLPTGYLLAFHFNLGVQGVWLGFVVGLTASALLLTTRFNLITNSPKSRV